MLREGWRRGPRALLLARPCCPRPRPRHPPLPPSTPPPSGRRVLRALQRLAPALRRGPRRLPAGGGGHRGRAARAGRKGGARGAHAACISYTAGSWDCTGARSVASSRRRAGTWERLACMPACCCHRPTLLERRPAPPADRAARLRIHALGALSNDAAGALPASAWNKHFCSSGKMAVLWPRHCTLAASLAASNPITCPCAPAGARHILQRALGAGVAQDLHARV